MFGHIKDLQQMLNANVADVGECDSHFQIPLYDIGHSLVACLCRGLNSRKRTNEYWIYATEESIALTDIKWID